MATYYGGIYLFLGIYLLISSKLLFSYRCKIKVLFFRYCVNPTQKSSFDLMDLFFCLLVLINRSTLGCLFSQCLASCCQDTCSTIADYSLKRRRCENRQQMANQQSFLTNQQTAHSTVMGLIQTRLRKKKTDQ